MPPRSERNIQYASPAVPSFLQKLHAQVNGNRGGGGSEHTSTIRGLEGGGDREWDEMFASSSSRCDSGSGPDDNDVERGEEWDGAQVVVLKEGRHLTEDEVRQLRKDQEEEKALHLSLSAADGSTPSIATASSAAPQGKRPRREPVLCTEIEDAPLLKTTKVKKQKTRQQGTDPLSSLRAMIQADRLAKGDERAGRGDVKDKKQSAKDAKQREVQQEKKKRGKGLSFEFQD